MPEPQWRLEMSMIGPFGERYTIGEPLEHSVARETAQINPPDALADFVPGKSALQVAVERLKRREFRRDLFEKEAARLGRLLAERMEDAEGWHGLDRVDPAKTVLSR